MRYFSLFSLGNDQDKNLVFLDREPDELAQHGYRLAQGKPMGDLYPDLVCFEMQPQSPGIKLPTLIGNTLNLLIVHEKMKEVILATNAQPLETWPITILNHKGRVHSTDYWIVNPIGTVDCVDFQRSEILQSETTPGRIVGIGRLVLLEEKLRAAPDIFRVQEHPECIVSADLGKALQGRGFTNVFLEEHEVTQGRATETDAMR